MASNLMIPSRRTRSRSELCPFRQEPVNDAHIIMNNQHRIEEYVDGSVAVNVTLFPGVMIVAGFVVNLGVGSRIGECSVINPLEDEIDPNNLGLVSVTLDITYALEEDDRHGDRLRIACEVREENVKISERARANLNATIEGLDL